MQAVLVWVVAAAVLQGAHSMNMGNSTMNMGNNTKNSLAKTGACFDDPKVASCAESTSYYTEMDRNMVRDREHV